MMQFREVLLECGEDEVHLGATERREQEGPGRGQGRAADSGSVEEGTAAAAADMNGSRRTLRPLHGRARHEHVHGDRGAERQSRPRSWCYPLRPRNNAIVIAPAFFVRDEKRQQHREKMNGERMRVRVDLGQKVSESQCPRRTKAGL